MKPYKVYLDKGDTVTKKLDPKIKEERAQKRKMEQIKKDKVKRNILTALLNEYGTVKKVAETLDVSISAIYERMKRLGIEMVETNPHQKVILEALLKQHKTIEKASYAYGMTPEEFKREMKLAGIKNSKK